MTSLMMKLAGPLQSWGTDSRFSVRQTQPHPSKSGIIGLIGAAEGRRRQDPIEDLLKLNFAVRIDKPGNLVRDFHTARNAKNGSMPLSDRYYLSDAVFLAGIEGPKDIIQGIDRALRSPRFPLFLGRRSCPPSVPVSLGMREVALGKAIIEEPWQAPEWFKGQCERQSGYQARIVADFGVLEHDDGKTEFVRDLPKSFDQANRQYAWRKTKSSSVTLLSGKQDPHDPMLLVDGGQSNVPV